MTTLGRAEDRTIRAVGQYLVCLRMAEEIKTGSSLHIPDAYKDDSIISGRVISMGYRARTVLPVVEIGDIVTVRRTDIVADVSRFYDSSAFVVRADECLVCETDIRRTRLRAHPGRG